MSNVQDLDDNVLILILKCKPMKGIDLKMKMPVSNYSVNSRRKRILTIAELNFDSVS